MEDNVDRYKLRRDSKEKRARQIRFRLGLGVGATVITIGAIGTVYSYIKTDNKNFGYNDSFNNYSTQLEEMMDVDISSDLETEINKLQDIRVVLNSYEEDDSIIGKGEHFKYLVDNYSTIESVALTVLKSEIAKENGVDPSNIEIKFETTDASIFAFIEGKGTCSIGGNDNYNLAKSIIELQGYSKEELEKTTKDTDFINKCNRVIKNTGKVAVNMSSKTK